MRLHGDITVLPLFALLTASTIWGLIWLPIRGLEHLGMPGLWINLVSYAVISLPGIVLMIRQRQNLLVHRTGLLTVALFAGWCNVAFVLAVIDGQVVRVLVLFYLSPLWSVLLGRLFLGEMMSGRTKTVFALAMCGMLCMLWSPALGFPWPQNTADWLALSSGISFSIANVTNRYLSGVPIAIKTVVTWVGVTLVAGIGTILLPTPLPVVDTQAWWYAAALGVFGFAFMTAAVQYGVSHLPVQLSAVILLFELVVGTVSSQLGTDEPILLREWLGGFMIFSAGLISAMMVSGKTINFFGWWHRAPKTRR